MARFGYDLDSTSAYSRLAMTDQAVAEFGLTHDTPFRSILIKGLLVRLIQVEGAKLVTGPKLNCSDKMDTPSNLWDLQSRPDGTGRIGATVAVGFAFVPLLLSVAVVRAVHVFV